VRSAAGWPGGPAAACAGTGVPSCTSPAAATLGADRGRWARCR
jgi:hypothetical protein